MRKFMKINRNITSLLFIILTISLSACGGDHKEYNHDGSLKSIGNILPNGEKDGEWQNFYPNGSLMSRGIYNKGEKEGSWTYWNKKGEIVAEKTYKNGIEITKGQKEAAPKLTQKHTAQPDPELKQKQETGHETNPEAEKTVEHTAADTPEAAVTDEPERTEPYVENSSGFAATMEEWKAMQKRMKEMPETETPADTATEEAKSEEAEPEHIPAPVVEQKVEISEPVQVAPVQEPEIEPVVEVDEPAEIVVEPETKKVPAQEKKPVKSGGKFWIK